MEREWFTIPKEPHGSGPWLKQRWALPTGEKLVSASVAGAIYNVHPFTSPEQLAAELLADNPPEPQEQNQAMERGNRLEQPLMDWANDLLGRVFYTPDELFIYTEGGARMIATLDGFDGDEILEIKTTTRDWTGELPHYWYVQGVHQAVCADREVVNWAVFDRSQTLNLYRQVVTSDEKQNHIRCVDKWLASIDLGMTPEGVSWTYDTISRRHPQDSDKTVNLGTTAAKIAAHLREVKAQIKALEAREDGLKAELCEMMGDAGTAVVGGDVIATWKTQVRKSLDQKALKAAHPDLIEQYTKDTQIRVLRLKGNN